MWQANRPRIAVAVFVCRPDGMFLMQRGSRSRYCGAGEWSVPGGKVRNGETAREAAVREVRAETGLRIQGVQTVAVTEQPLCACGEHWITFWLKTEGGVIGSLDTTKNTDGHQWVKWGDWPQPLYQPQWDNLFDTLDSSHRISMTGGLRL